MLFKIKFNLIFIICLHPVKWFDISFNTNTSISVQINGFQVFLFKANYPIKYQSFVCT